MPILEMFGYINPQKCYFAKVLSAYQSPFSLSRFMFITTLSGNPAHTNVGLSRVAAVEKGEANEKVPLSTSFSRVAAQDVQRWLSQIRAATRDNPNR
ncbi:uncharacterized protein LOC113334240 isoform X2 [Papaver somniferum]|nr:uncharacterized protein LOC113334240 isoform X2 [Papaver somniferum]